VRIPRASCHLGTTAVSVNLSLRATCSALAARSRSRSRSVSPTIISTSMPSKDSIRGGIRHSDDEAIEELTQDTSTSQTLPAASTSIHQRNLHDLRESSAHDIPPNRTSPVRMSRQRRLPDRLIGSCDRGRRGGKMPLCGQDGPNQVGSAHGQLFRILALTSSLDWALGRGQSHGRESDQLRKGISHELQLDR
jgi:hypothetical protein